jgi:hypothetical protein
VFEPLDYGSVCIRTEKGDRFIIDADDIAIAIRHCWSRNTNGYARAVTRDSSGQSKTIYLHRLICKATSAKPHVDHVSGDITDCRRINLRRCTRSENLSNQKLRADNTSGFKGVDLHKQTGKYRARVQVRGAEHHLGLFDTAEAAKAAAIIARVNLHGEFARHA